MNIVLVIAIACLLMGTGFGMLALAGIRYLMRYGKSKMLLVGNDGSLDEHWFSAKESHFMKGRGNHARAYPLAHRARFQQTGRNINWYINHKESGHSLIAPKFKDTLKDAALAPLTIMDPTQLASAILRNHVQDGVETMYEPDRSWISKAAMWGVAALLVLMIPITVVLAKNAGG